MSNFTTHNPSRPPSPLPAQPNGTDAQLMEARGSLDGWPEPPRRVPVPSFMDYRGLERGGVLENMQALGTFPSTRVKTKAKAEPLRRTMQARNLVGLALEGLRSTPEGTSVAASSRAGSMFPEEPVNVTSPASEELTGRDSTPDQARVVWQQSNLSRPPPLPSPSGHTTPMSLSKNLQSPNEAGSPFNKALQLASHNAEPDVAQALLAMHQEVQQDPELNTLLATLAGNKSNPEQIRALHKKLNKIKKRINSQSPSPYVDQASTIGSGSLRPIKSSSRSPSKTAPNTIIPATNKEQQPPSMIDPELSSIPQRPSFVKLSITNKNSSTSTNGISVSSMNSLPKPSVTTPAKVVSRRASSSSLSSVDDGLVEGPPPGLAVPIDPLRSRKRSSEEAGPFLDSDDNELDATRKRLKRSFDNVEVRESHLRPELKPSGRKTTSTADLPMSSTSISRLVLSSGSARVRNNASDVGVLTPASDGFPTGVPGHSPPTNLGRPRKAAKASVGAKIKMSPVKNKKPAVIAGIARPESRRHGSVGYDGNSEQSDNNDFCSSCSGSGFLLCCDGCDRAFHFTCLDPPLNQNAALDEPWFCYICHARKEPGERPPRGLFSVLAETIGKKNPTAFYLPEDIREYFEGVRTGEDGEYVDAPVPRASAKSRMGYDEQPDFKRTIDAKGNAILCFSCGRSSGGRLIISCDYCTLHWHLDCLNPPIANPPSRGGLNGKARYPWKCPNHADHDLDNIDPIQRMGVRQDGVRRAHRVRRPKNVTIIDTALRRGLKNNGLVEVADESSDESDFSDQEGIDGTIFRLPARGIKLDFIYKVKSNQLAETQAAIATTAKQNLHTARVQASKEARNLEIARSKAQTEALNLDIARLQAQNEALNVENSRKIAADIRRRSTIEQTVIFNLVQAATGSGDLHLGGNRLEDLLNTGIAEAPREVIEQMIEDESPAGPMMTSTTHSLGAKVCRKASSALGNVPPSPPASSDQHDSAKMSRRQALLVLKAWVERSLDDDHASA